MLNNDLHRLLKRQLKKAGLNDFDNPGMADFLSTINDAYKSFDKDIYHIENIHSSFLKVLCLRKIDIDL